MMAAHPTHDFPPPAANRWRCLRCDCSPMSPDATLAWRPLPSFTDDPRAGLPCDMEPTDAD